MKESNRMGSLFDSAPTEVKAMAPVIEMAAAEGGAPTRGGVRRTLGYEAVRFNAMRHGILARLAVLPHEDAQEFDGLLDALVGEHQPGSPTEMHLVEELAALIWRKRRVLLAEGAAINRGLRNVAQRECDSPVAAAAPFERGVMSDRQDLRDVVLASHEEALERQREAAADLAATRKAAAILRRGGVDAYEKARRALLPDSRDWWDEYVTAEAYPATAEGLDAFISERLEPCCFQLDREARVQPAVKAQVLGDGLQVHRLEKLNRYETHLDRKFERTLGMLLKLKELRAR